MCTPPRRIIPYCSWASASLVLFLFQYSAGVSFFRLSRCGCVGCPAFFFFAGGPFFSLAGSFFSPAGIFGGQFFFLGGQFPGPSFRWLLTTIRPTWRSLSVTAFRFFISTMSTLTGRRRVSLAAHMSSGAACTSQPVRERDKGSRTSSDPSRTYDTHTSG